MLSSLLTKYMHEDSNLDIDELEDCIRWSCGAIFAGIFVLHLLNSLVLTFRAGDCVAGVTPVGFNDISHLVIG
jgi:hypothetical protein